jgi:hypothetical protein
VSTPIKFIELSCRFKAHAFTYKWSGMTIRIVDQGGVDKVCQQFQQWKVTNAGEDFMLAVKAAAAASSDPLIPFNTPGGTKPFLSPAAAAAVGTIALATVKAEQKHTNLDQSNFKKIQARSAASGKQHGLGSFFAAIVPLSEEEKAEKHREGQKKVEALEKKKRLEGEKQILLAKEFEWDWPIPKQTDKTKPSTEVRYNNAVRDYIISSAKTAGLSADGLNLVWRGDAPVPSAPPQKPPVGYKKGTSIDRAIELDKSLKRKAAEQASGVDKKQKRSGAQRTAREKKLFYDMANSPWGQDLGLPKRVELAKSIMPGVFDEKFTRTTVARWNKNDRLDELDAAGWAQYIKDDEEGKSVADLEQIQRTSDPYNFEDYRSFLPVHVLYACRAIAKSFIDSGIPADSTVLEPAFVGVVKGMGCGHLLAPEGAIGGKGKDDGNDCVERNPAGDVISRKLILNQRWTNKFCRRANLTMRAATASKEKEPTEKELHDTKEIFNLRYVWLVKKFGIMIDFTCNLDGPPCPRDRPAWPFPNNKVIYFKINRFRVLAY